METSSLAVYGKKAFNLISNENILTLEITNDFSPDPTHLSQDSAINQPLHGFKSSIRGRVSKAGSKGHTYLNATVFGLYVHLTVVHGGLHLYHTAPGSVVNIPPSLEKSLLIPLID